MNQPIRVAQILASMTGYGTESRTMDYYRYLDRSRIQFDFIAHDDSTRIPYEEIEELGGHVFTIPSYQHLGKYLNALTDLLRQNQYQIAHSHISTMSMFPLYAAWKAGVPVRIVHNHSTAAKGEWKKNVIKYALRPFGRAFATDYAAVSYDSAVWLFGRRFVEREEVAIVNPAVRQELYRYDEAVRIQVRRELNIGDKFVVGHVGRFCYQKNHEFLIDVFQAIRKRRTDALLLLVGDGDTKDAVEKKVKKLGLSGSVLMPGNRSDAGRLYQAMDVFVLPSRYEGLPAASVEAQLAGLKVVASARITRDAKIRKDMTFLELSAGAEKWAEEALRVNTGPRACTGDFSAFDVSCQAKRLEQFYLSRFEGGRSVR